MKFVLGIDLGTSSLKVSAYTEDLVPVHHNKQSYSTRYMPDGGCEQDASDWWKALQQALKEISQYISLQAVQAVGFSGFNALVGVDAYGEACGPAITYLDKRGLDVFAKLKERISGDFIFKKTKNNFTSGGTWAPTLCWLREEMPDYWANSVTFVSCSGFLAGLLTKEFAVDSSRASFSLLYDVAGNDLDWDDELCDLFGIDRAKLPPILHSWDSVGTVQSDISHITGLPEGIPVVIGGVDSMCAALGSGVFNESTVFDIGGSAGGLAAVSTSIKADPRFLNVRFVLPGHWANIGPLSVAGSAWKWLQNDLLDNRITSEELLEKAGNMTPGSNGVLFLPYLAGVRSPYWDMSVKATFHGFTMQHHAGHMARALLEGVTFAQKEVLSGLLELGYTPKEVRAAGGGADNSLWMQMKADVLDIPHTSLTIQEASAFGAALLTAYSVGIVTDFKDLFTKADSQASYWHSQPEIHGFYKETYLRWSKLRDRMFEPDLF
jgi:xylulokinase